MKVHDGYYADPFVIRDASGYVAYGTNPDCAFEREFEVLTSNDLVHWTSHGGALSRPSPELGSDFWAPEVAFADDRWWMYYSVGHGISGHHIRVAVANDPLGPFQDLGLNLTPDERFAIDAHPFMDHDGQWYLYFARDVLNSTRPGTHLAVAQLEDMTHLGAKTLSVLQPNADWQLYERNRAIYGGEYDWHTLEGPSVVYRSGRYWLTYSGGAWTGAGYAVSWAVADSPQGPWRSPHNHGDALLRTTGELIGPGHNSLTVDSNDGDVIVFHSWNQTQTRREMHLCPIVFGADRPRVKL